jgi:hypothetical protein
MSSRSLRRFALAHGPHDERFISLALLLATSAFSAEPEPPVLEPDDKVLVAAVSTVASIPGPHQFAGQIEVGALVMHPGPPQKGKVKFSPPTYGWVSITTDEKSLKMTAAQYAKALEDTLKIDRTRRYPAPCVTTSAMDDVVMTAVIRTDGGYLGLASTQSKVRTLTSPEPDEAKARAAIMKLANEIAQSELGYSPLVPAKVNNLHHKALESGRLSRDWAQTP